MTGFLITCINDLKLLLVGSTPAREAVNGNLSGNSGILPTLVQPAIEYIVRCLFKDLKQVRPDYYSDSAPLQVHVMVESNMLILGCALLHKSCLRRE